MFNIFNKIRRYFGSCEYDALVGDDNRVMIGHQRAFDYDNKIVDVPLFVVKKYKDRWQLGIYVCDDIDQPALPSHWNKLEGSELCQAINHDYELYKASGKDKRLLKHFKPLIDDAIKSDRMDVSFESKESAIITGKTVIFMMKHNGPEYAKWLY